MQRLVPFTSLTVDSVVFPQILVPCCQQARSGCRNGAHRSGSPGQLKKGLCHHHHHQWIPQEELIHPMFLPCVNLTNILSTNCRFLITPFPIPYVGRIPDKCNLNYAMQIIILLMNTPLAYCDRGVTLPLQFSFPNPIIYV